MELSCHPDQPFVIVSLWHHDVCRATFRLPLDDVADVIATLAGSLGEATVRRPNDVAPVTARLRPTLWVRLRSRVPRPLGEVVSMVEHRAPGPGSTAEPPTPEGPAAGTE